MNSWALEQAKSQFSKVVQLALHEGPQTVTRRGEPVVVVMSAEAFRKLAQPKESVLEFFGRFRGSGLRLERRRDLPQRIDL